MNNEILTSTRLYRFINLLLITGTTLFISHSLFLMWDLRIPVIFADQWQIFEVFLGQTFPENVLTIQNSQRPVFPRLIFLLDIELFSGNQWFPQLMAMIFTLVSVGSLAYLALTDRLIPKNVQYAAIAIFALMMFWMGSSRTLLHANESASAYLVIASYILAIALLHHAKNKLLAPNKGIILWIILSGVFCFIATFSFGTGIATYPAILITALLLRLPLSHILPLAGFFALAMGIQISGLAAEDNTSILTSFEPLRIIEYTFKWLSGPMLYLASGVTDLNSNNQLAYIDETFAVPVGALVFILAGIMTLYRLYKPTNSRLETGALGILIFSIGVAVIVSLGRAKFFDIFHAQIYAQRYIVWSSLAWSSLIILLLIHVSRIPFKHLSITVSLSICILLALPILKSEEKWLSHADTYYFKAENCQLAIRLNITHNSVSRDCDIWPSKEYIQRFYKTVELVKNENIGPFNTNFNHLLGTNPLQNFELKDANRFKGAVALSKVLKDTSNHSLFARLHGMAVDTEKAAAPDMVLVVDDNSLVQGVALPTRLKIDTAKSMRLPRLLRFGLTGFIKHYDPIQNYTAYTLSGDQLRPFGKLRATEKSRKLPD